MIYQFPKDFIWGTAASALQTEGNNTNSDWWRWENNKAPEDKYPLESSGIACDSYHRYEEDLDLCVKLNNNAYRTSVAWGRMQPTPDTFDVKEIEHYRNFLKAAKLRNLKTFITLHHFSNPIWFADMGGWANPKAPVLFEIYAKKCAQVFGDLVDVYLTINEPQVYMNQCYISGAWPPNRENLFLALRVQQNLIKAHKRAYRAIKSVGPHTVGLVKNIIWFEQQPSTYSPVDWLAAKLLFFSNCDQYLRQIGKDLDLIGVNYYFTTRLRGLMLHNLDDVQSDLGWWVYPKGLEHILLHLRKYNLPIYITENGVADCTDRIRKDFIRDMLISCNKAMEQGADVRGYFYWSLIDNYEWHRGYDPKFGLVYVDRKNELARIPRESFYYYAGICKSGRIEK